MSMPGATPARVVDWITVEGFKSIQRVEELPLNPINILIGPNGAGKTNLIEAFLLLDRIRNGNLQEYVIRAGGANRILHFGSAMTQEVTVGISCHECLYRYEIKLASTESDGLSPLSEYGYIDHPEFSRPVEVNFAPRGTEPALSRSTLSADDSSDMWDTLVQLQDNWPGPFFLDASATAPIKRLASINDNRRLRSDGSNLASFLYYLRRLIVHVEGETEETFINEVLGPHLLSKGYSKVSARLIGNARQRSQRGRIKAWQTVRKEIMNHLMADRQSIATTMVDYYGLLCGTGREHGRGEQPPEHFRFL